MRHLYFLIFIGIIGISAVGLIHFSRQFFDACGLAVDSKLQANLSAIQLNEVRFSRKAAANKEITLLFTGDIMLSRGIAGQIKKHQDPRYPFLKIASTTQEADLTFGNLEGPISSRGRNQGSIYSFRAKPEVIEGLKFAGFDILSLVNNHIWDWGKEALEDTLSILKYTGIETVGAGRNYKEANEPAVFEVNSILRTSEVLNINNNFETSDVQKFKKLNTRIAFLSYTNLYPDSFNAIGDSAGISDFALDRVKKEISQIKIHSINSEQAADIVIISFHWGDEYQTRSNKTQQNIAHALIGAGADLIVGHHPHTVQEIERYQNGWIAYSLGNFVFDQNFSEETREGLMLKVKIQDKKIVEVKPIKIKFSDTFQPEIVGL